MSSDNKSIEEVAAKILQATNEVVKHTTLYNKAKEHYQIASRDMTSALNNLNIKQKALSDLFAEAQKDAPIDSDWSRVFREKNTKAIPLKD